MKRRPQPKQKQTQTEQPSPDSHPEESCSTRRKGRQDNSLSVLTIKFIELLKKSQNYTIDLNSAVKQLGVQKRRIYDITNVLEGISCVQKTQKNMIKWIGYPNQNDEQVQVQEMRKMLHELTVQQQAIDKKMLSINKSLKEQYLQNQQYRQYKYITYNDCLNMYKSMCNGQKDKGLMVLSAPKGTKLQIRQDQSGESTLHMESDGKGTIKAFCCDDKGVRQLQITQKQK